MGTSSQDRLRGTRYIVMGWGGTSEILNFVRMGPSETSPTIRRVSHGGIRQDLLTGANSPVNGVTFARIDRLMMP